jgi:hypothetical protein
MKLKILFLALFGAGLAASIALASPSTGSTTSSSTATTATTGTSTGGKGEHGKKGKSKGKEKDDDEGEAGRKGKKAHGCRSIELKGTLSASSVTLAVAKSNRAGSDLKGKQVTLSLAGGPAKVRAIVCTTGTATTTQTLQVRELRVSGGPTTTGTTTTTTTTG